MRIWLASSGPNALTQTLPGLCCGRLGSRRRTGVQRLGSHPTCPPSFRPKLPIPGVSSRMGNRSQGVVCEACAEEHRWPWDTAGESRGRMSALRNQTPGLWRLELRLQGPQGVSTAELQGAPFTLCSKGRALGQPGGSLWQGPSGPVAPGETERESGHVGMRTSAYVWVSGSPRPHAPALAGSAPRKAGPLVSDPLTAKRPELSASAALSELGESKKPQYSAESPPGHRGGLFGMGAGKAVQIGPSLGKRWLVLVLGAFAMTTALLAPGGSHPLLPWGGCQSRASNLSPTLGHGDPLPHGP